MFFFPCCSLLFALHPSHSSRQMSGNKSFLHFCLAWIFPLTALPPVWLLFGLMTLTRSKNHPINYPVHWNLCTIWCYVRGKTTYSQIRTNVFSCCFLLLLLFIYICFFLLYRSELDSIATKTIIHSHSIDLLSAYARIFINNGKWSWLGVYYSFIVCVAIEIKMLHNTMDDIRTKTSCLLAYPQVI